MASSTGLYPSLVRDTRVLLEDRIGHFLAELTNGSGDPLTSGELLSKAFKAFYLLKGKLDTDRLDCAVLALAKSGKSTLLNSFCGATILPSNNVPETARVVALEHCHLKAGEEPVLKYRIDGQDIEFSGDEAIRAQLEYLNKEVRGRRHRKSDETILTVRTELAALKDETQEASVGLRLLDTPGPNEAGEEALKHSVERLLDSVDAVVYVLDYTKLKTKEEAELLTKLSESNPQLIQRLAQRLFFVVNKVDEMHVTEGLDEDQLRDYVADLVTRQMNIPTFQLHPEQVFLVSAQDALLSRLILAGKATIKEQERFAKKAFGKAWKKASAAEYQETAIEMLEDSHVLDLEDSLLSYLYDHAGILKLVSMLDGIVKLLTEIKNVGITGQGAMKVSAETLAAEIKDLQASLLTTSQEFLAVQQEANTVEDTVVENVRQRMLNLRGRLLNHINEVLDPESAETGPIENTESARNNSGWNWILQKSTAFFVRHRTHPPLDSDAALKAKLTDLHKDIKHQIEVEITDFWHELETATNAKHKELIAVINGHLLELARRIEGSVGRVLDLCLKPLDICLQKPSAEEFHNSIQDLLKSGIKRGLKTETKQRQEEHMEWQKRFKGLCNQTEYWEGKPTKRWVSYQEQTVTFDLNPESIMAHFHTMVESNIDLSVQRVKEYVHAFMSNQIQTAHDKITSYSKLYTDTMTSALRAKSLSAAEQTASLAAVEKHLMSVNCLLDEVSAIAKTVSTMFPQLDIDNFEWIEGDSEDESKPAGDHETQLNCNSVPDESILLRDLPSTSDPVRALRDAMFAPLPDDDVHPLPEAAGPKNSAEEVRDVGQPSQNPPPYAAPSQSALQFLDLDPLPRRGASIIGEDTSDEDTVTSTDSSDGDDNSEAGIAYLSEDPDAIYDEESEDNSEDTYDDSEDEDDEDESDFLEEVAEEDTEEEDDDSEGDSEVDDVDEFSDEDEDDESDTPFDVDTAFEDTQEHLSESEAKRYPALAKSLSAGAKEAISTAHTDEQVPPVISTLSEDKSATSGEAAELQIPETDDRARAWTKHMTQNMTGLQVHDSTPTQQLPISNEAEATGHFVSSPRGPAGDTEMNTSPLHSSRSDGTSDEWECLSETEIPPNA